MLALFKVGLGRYRRTENKGPRDVLILRQSLTVRRRGRLKDVFVRARHRQRARFGVSALGNAAQAAEGIPEATPKHIAFVAGGHKKLLFRADVNPKHGDAKSAIERASTHGRHSPEVTNSYHTGAPS